MENTVMEGTVMESTAMESTFNNPAHSGFRFALVLAGAFALTACGGGGGGDNSESGGVTFNSSQATVSSSAEAEDVSEASRQAAGQAIYAQDAFSFPVAAESQQVETIQTISDISLNLALANMLPSAADTNSVPGDCPGHPGEAIYTGYSETHIKVTYSDFCTGTDDGELVINGYVDMHFADDKSSYNAEFDVTYDYLGESQNSAGSISCSGDALDNCTYTTDFTGTNGIRYRVKNVSVSGNNSSGYNVSARVYLQDQGYVDFTGTGLIICTDGSGFSTGDISISDSSGVIASATFSGCGSNYTVTYKGSTSSVPQI